VKAIAAATNRRRARSSLGSGSTVEPLRDAERTKQAILDAAKIEFAEKGLAGARVDTISEQSGANKRMLYYYFGSKDDLYTAVLEDVYGAMRRTERELDLTHLEPLQALQRLVEFKFDYYLNNPIVIRILAGENFHDAQFLKRSKKLRDMHVSLVESLQVVLAAGKKKGLMKGNVDPIRLYITIAGLSYFYFSNSATLSTAFDRALMSPPELERWRAHAVQVILSYVRP
jgi:AcrR family transcriptional regulator